MRLSLLSLTLLLGLTVAACQQNPSVGAAVDDKHAEKEAKVDGGDDEVEVALSEVPQAVKDAALAAVPGLVLSEACKEVEKGVTVYCLEGKANGKEYEIDVTADGKVLEVEAEGGEKDEDEDGD